EVRRVATSPLEVVHVRPVEVPTNVHPIPDRGVDVGQDVGQVFLAHAVVLRGDPVLGDVHGLAVTLQLVQHAAHPVRVGTPSHLGLYGPGGVEATHELVLRPAQSERGHLTRVVGDSDGIAPCLYDPLPPRPARPPA